MIRKRLRSEAVTLFAENTASRVLDAGPWVVHLAKAPEVARALERLDPSLPWGYYVHASIDLMSLRQTLRRFNLARLPNPDREVLFRYWDPRVMKAFLKIGSRSQRSKLFDFIDLIEAADGSFVGRPPS